GGTLRIADVVGPISAGYPAHRRFRIGGHCLDIFMDTILKGDNRGNIYPNLATQWVLAPDMRSIALTLRKGVKFHDGSDWNATSAKWNIDILVDAKLGAYRSIKSVDIVDDYTIRINLKEYSNTLLYNLAGTRVVSKAAYDKNGKEWMNLNPVGTGPFKLVSFEPQVSIKGVRFDDYWQEGKPYLDAIEMSFITDTMTKSASLQAGEVDIIGGDLSRVEYELQQKGFEIIKGYISIYCLMPDSKNTDSVFSDIRVREALDYAIDRDSLVKSLGFGFWSPTYQFALPGTTAYVEGLKRPYNPAKAKQLLADAGYPNGFKSTIHVDTFVSNIDAVTAIQGYLSKVGINVNLTMQDMAGFGALAMKGWKDSLLGAARSTAANLNYSLTSWTKDSAWHVSVDKTDEFYNLYKAAFTSKEYDVALTKKAVQYMFDNAMITPVYAVSRGIVLPSYVHDTGFYTRQTFWHWEPSNTWLSK
ncbi:ABC transporter substrate-binding protein, partial [Thermodesulfobacteriota bacterium]